jgi:hypothetical protein
MATKVETNTWDELADSGRGTVNFNEPSFEKQFLAIGYLDHDAIIAQCETKLDKFITINGVTLFLHEYKVEPRDARADGPLWIVTASYRYTVDYFEMSFDNSGAHAKIFQALDHGTYYDLWTGLPWDPAGVTGQIQPDFGGMIGVNNNTVAGVDVPIAHFDFTILIRSKLKSLPSSYVMTVSRLVGCTNDRPLVLNWQGQIYNFDVEELLFKGMPGKQVSNGDLELTMKFSWEESFAASDDLKAGNYTGIVKKGQRYLWIFCEQGIIAGRSVPRPSVGVVNQVFKPDDLSQIGIFGPGLGTAGEFE